jgi:hypothetical protein
MVDVNAPVVEPSLVIVVNAVVGLGDVLHMTPLAEMPV